MKRTEVISKKRHIIFFTIIMIFVIFAGMLAGCDKQAAETLSGETTSENEAESESVEAPMPEDVEEPVSEIEKETIELSPDEYYVDYPLVLEDGRKVYIKIAPNLHFYPDGVLASDMTCLQRYEEWNELQTHISMESDNNVSEAGVTYGIEKEYELINWMMNPNDVDWSYKISKPKNWDSGIIAYNLKQIWETGETQEQHILYYPMNEYQVVININYYVGDFADEQLPEEQQAVLDFYCTEDNLFVVIDPETTDVVVSDTTDISAIVAIETTGGPTSAPEPPEVPEPTEIPETSKPEEEPAVTPTPTEPAQPAHTHSYNSVVTQATCVNDGCITYTCSCGDTYTDKIPATGTHSYGYGEMNCQFCGTPHTHDWKIVVQTNSGVEITPDEDFCCHSGWYFDTYEELRAHMDIPNVHGMVYLNDGSNGVTSVPPDYDGHVDFYASCHGWANCAGDGEGERIEYEITQEVQFCKICGVRGEATDVGERVILVHTYDD